LQSAGAAHREDGFGDEEKSVLYRLRFGINDRVIDSNQLCRFGKTEENEGGKIDLGGETPGRKTAGTLLARLNRGGKPTGELGGVN